MFMAGSRSFTNLIEEEFKKSNILEVNEIYDRICSKMKYGPDDVQRAKHKIRKSLQTLTNSGSIRRVSAGRYELIKNN